MNFAFFLNGAGAVIKKFFDQMAAVGGGDQNNIGGGGFNGAFQQSLQPLIGSLVFLKGKIVDKKNKFFPAVF